MNDDSLNNLVYSRNVIEFVTVANEFCSFLEKSDGFVVAEFLERSQKLLPLLYLKASLLPLVEANSEEASEKFVSEMDYNLIQQKVLKLTGSYDDYNEVFLDGMEFSESPLVASISEDMADIYQDIKDFITVYSLGNEEAMEIALWECQNSFAQLWGQRLVNCLRAVHRLVYADNSSDDLGNGDQNQIDNNSRKPDWLNQRFTHGGDL